MMSLYSLLLGILLAGTDAPIVADLLLRNATIHDGGGGAGVVGDVAVRKDRIVAVGRFTVAGQPRILDGTGLIAAPGFIDLHTHCDFTLTQPATRSNLCYLYQGVTTVVTGNCGAGPVHVADYVRKLAKGGVGTNVIHLMPHNAIREQVMKNANRVPTAEELRRMEELVAQGMKDGAWGLSTGLIYNPGAYAKTAEIIALARVAARHQGIYASHIRDEGTGVLSALDEALTIGRQARLPVHISHLKASGRKAWGKAADEVALIRQARQAGQTVTADQYPYVASSTSLAAILVPPHFREGTHAEYLARFDDPEQGPRLRQAIAEGLSSQESRLIRIAAYAPQPSWQGKDLAAIARLTKKSPVAVVQEIERHGGAQVVHFGMNEEDVCLIMRQPFVATASDGAGQVLTAKSVPHPRSYGCFPRKIGHYARDEKILSLPQAIRSASGLPADILRLKDRGYLKPGYVADIVVFDPEKYRDRATFAQPHQLASGVRYVLVNGRVVLREGQYTGTLAGRALRHP